MTKLSPRALVRAVTFGPFPPGAKMETRDQLEMIADCGVTHLRLYEEPSERLVEYCRETGLKLFLTLPWTQHLDFIAEPNHLSEAKARLKLWVGRWRGDSVVDGYLVGNEIPAQLVRWMGPAQVQRAIEMLIDAGRSVDEDALFSYANYPTTEYLSPRNQDFVSFNVYLEDRIAFANYLRRLRHISGRKPLLITEFGCDSAHHGLGRQGEILQWHVDEICRAGLSGTTVFSWSDLWWRGGSEVTGWDFGLLDRDGIAKPAQRALSERWRAIASAVDGVKVRCYPRISVIVCTYRGAATLESCLTSLTELRYPGDYEIILVNDGDDFLVQELAKTFPSVRYFAVEHGGLSAARNSGAAEATGDVFAYTDDDCIAPPDWLTWLALEYEDGEWGAVGGPNYPPAPSNWVRAAVAAAPGGPSHVMLTDREAEHIPGCNLTVRREAFEQIGGFDSQFWTAGDDVDFCWRLQDAGWKIGFHPEAWVWHHRRFSIRAFFKQQKGYGRAEAMLLAKHPDKHSDAGGTRWHGMIYAESGSAGTSLTNPAARIYQGEFGGAPFQRIYGSDLITGHGLPREFDQLKARALVWVLTLLQPIVRAWSWIRASGRRPAIRHLISWNQHRDIRSSRGGEVLELWSTRDRGREALLDEILVESRRLGWPVSTGDGWSDYDMEILTKPDDRIIRLTTVTEYHAEGWLTKVRVSPGQLPEQLMAVVDRLRD